ncbi:MAG: hypothetical protein QNJ44_21975 [Rhodobacter sp.]|nr:hypothetical protein [Rhodobacter sp.]
MEYRRKHARFRPRSWFSLFFRLGGWLSLICGLALLAVTYFSAGALYLADRLDRAGDLAYAVVADRRAAATGDEGETTRYVTFTFKARGAGGQTVEVEVPAEYFDAVSVGDELPIRYLSNDPAQIEYDVGGYRRTGERLRRIALALGIAGLVTLWVFGRAANRAIKVRRDGEKRMATVTRIVEAGSAKTGKKQGRLAWYEEDGQTGESLRHDLEDLENRYQAGDLIAVYRLGTDAYWEGDVGPPKRDIPGR